MRQPSSHQAAAVQLTAVLDADAGGSRKSAAGADLLEVVLQLGDQVVELLLLLGIRQVNQAVLKLQDETTLQLLVNLRISDPMLSGLVQLETSRDITKCVRMLGSWVM